MQSHTWNNSIIHGEHVNFIFNLNFSFSLVVPINTRTFAVLSANELVMRAIESLWFTEKWTMTLISTFSCQQTVTMTVYWPCLLAILHAFRITFCVSSPVDSFFCGVTFGNCSMKIYRKKQNKTKKKRNVTSWFNSKILKFAQNQLYLFQTGYLRLFLVQLHFNSMSMLIETKIYSCNLKS